MNTFGDFKIRSSNLKKYILLSVITLWYIFKRNNFSNKCLLSFPGVIAIAEINEALNSSDHQQTLAALLLPTAKLTGVNAATAKHYHDVLQYTKRLLCQVSRVSFGVNLSRLYLKVKGQNVVWFKSLILVEDVYTQVIYVKFSIIMLPKCCTANYYTYIMYM